VNAISFYYFRETGVFAWLIRWFTKSKYAHVETVFGSDFRLKVENGKPARLAYGGRKPQKVVTFSVAPVEYARALQLAQSMIGQEYDWKGIAGQAAGVLTEDPQRVFCSEAAAKIAMTACIIDKSRPAEWYSPQRLAVVMGAA
jgi:hypothetical protein